jgi:hypothetical protein
MKKIRFLLVVLFAGILWNWNANSALAACSCNGGSGDTAYVCTMSGGEWKCNEATGEGYGTTLGNQIIKQWTDKQAALEDENVNQENWIKESAITNGFLINNTLIGQDTTAMLTNPSWTPKGLIGLTNNTIASLFNPPISGVQYIADSVNSLLGKPTYAAASGTFNKLTGILPLWKASRNLVYTLISIVFVVMGLLIMLRIKISPQATVTIQNSIPKIITTLILVTFSYAIIGLIIDLTYLIQALFLSLLLNNNGISQNIIKNIPEVSNLVKNNFGTHISLFFTATLGTINFGTVILSALTALVGWGIGTMIGGPLSFLTFLGGVLGLFIILIFAFIQLIKFFFGCAKAYIILLLKIISAPLEIALGAFPNSKIGFSSWFIQTIAYASVFPICLIFLVLLIVITNAVSFNEIWTPGILQGMGISSAIRPLLSFAGLMILAKLPSLIPEAIFQIKPSPFGKAIGEGFQKFPGVGLIKGGVGVVKSGASLAISQGLSSNPRFQRIATKFTKFGNGKADQKEIEKGKPQKVISGRDTEGAPES